MFVVCRGQEYDAKRRGPFPGDLWRLSRTVAQSLGFDDFEAEAAIVNYYAMSSSLGGHTDRSEENRSAPLLSFRSVQAAVPASSLHQHPETALPDRQNLLSSWKKLSYPSPYLKEKEYPSYSNRITTVITWDKNLIEREHARPLDVVREWTIRLLIGC